MKRPEPWTDDPPEGHHFEVVADLDWRVQGGRACRYTVVGHQTCKKPSVAEFNRGRWQPGGRVPSWWAYCEEHLYGRWIENGYVVRWVLREDGPS